MKTLYSAPTEARRVVPNLVSQYDWPTTLKLDEYGKIVTDPVDLRQMLLDAGVSEVDVTVDRKVFTPMAYHHLAELSDKFVAWAMTQLDPA